ncbi:MAG: response regulator, partial [Gemmatimonadetes bacterium]|nr:response regulator [Gemmatimonadota bacterium]
MSRGRILVVDDEPDMLENCRRLLAAEGYSCWTLGEPLGFHELFHEVRPDALLLDLRMPAVSGLSILAAALAEDPALPVVVITAYASIASAVQAMREGAFDYLAKPFTGDQLVVAVDRAARYRGLTLENRALRERVDRGAPDDDIVGSSPAFVR